MIEDALRQTFAAQVQHAPTPTDVADTVIGRARGVRRRRAAGSTLAGVAVLLVTGAVALQVQPGAHQQSGGDPLSVPDLRPSVVESSGAAGVSRPPEAPVEIVVDNEIHLQGNQRLRLSFDVNGASGSRVTRVYRARDGFLVITEKESRQQLYRLDAQGRQDVLLSQADAVAVSGSGDRVAWRLGTTMSVASRQGDKLGDTKSTPAPAVGGPTEFAGGQVLLSRPVTEQPAASSPPPAAPSASPAPTSADPTPSTGVRTTRSYDRWDPSLGPYTETWSADVIHIYGGLPDGRHIVAQVVDPVRHIPCLGLLVAGQPFRIIDTACELPRAVGALGKVSPDGRLLAYPVSATPPTVALVDLSSVFGGVPTAQQKRLTGQVRSMVWHDPATLVVDTGDALVRIPATSGGQPQVLKEVTGDRVLVEPLAGLTG